MDDGSAPRTAPFHSIPPRRLVSVEHPAVIQDVDKAIDTLQGDAGVSKFLNPPKADTPAHLILRPEDAMARPMRSTSSAANNILVKVTVPKRAARKRKRGSDEPFTDSSPAGETGPERRTAGDVLQSLRDNVGRYQVEPVGLVQRSHVFRGMPDFVFSTAASPFTNRFRDQILSFDLDKMKDFDIDLAKGATSNVDVIPPPSFSHGDVPFSYMYRQNPSVRHSTDPAGNTTTINLQQAPKVRTCLVKYDEAAPTGPRLPCPPISTLDTALQQTIAHIQPLFDKQPVWTRRALRNSLPSPDLRHVLRYAIPYVGYLFRSGPWRDAIVKFGHDPRSSPSYHIYQTFMFKLSPLEPELARDGGGGRRHNVPRINPETYPDMTAEDTAQLQTGDSHIFTGLPPLARGGRVWMVCDLADPLLRRVLFPDPAPEGFLRQECEVLCDGWYGNGTLAKAKTIMRNKIHALAEDRVPDNSEFESILAFPEHATSDEDIARLFSLDPQKVSNRELLLATEVRGNIKSATNWRGMRKEKRGEAADGSSGKRVQFNDVDEQSEGEEEELERKEMADAAAAAVEEADEGADEGEED